MGSGHRLDSLYVRVIELHRMHRRAGQSKFHIWQTESLKNTGKSAARDCKAYIDLEESTQRVA